jgi:hypothetical protein
MNDFLMGAVAMGYAVVGLFFLRFWSQSRDRLFLLFSFAFFLLAVNRVARTILQDINEHSLFPYLVRLFAFLDILVAIIDKNMSRR